MRWHLALNLLAFGLLMMPLAMPPPAIDLPREPSLVARDIPPEVIVPVEIVKQKQPVTRSAAGAARHAAPANSRPAATRWSARPAASRWWTRPRRRRTGRCGSGGDGPPPRSSYNTRLPRRRSTRATRAARLGWTGTVLLQVLVGIDGRPLDVTIAGAAVIANSTKPRANRLSSAGASSHDAGRACGVQALGTGADRVRAAALRPRHKRPRAARALGQARW